MADLATHLPLSEWWAIAATAAALTTTGLLLKNTTRQRRPDSARTPPRGLTRERLTAAIQYTLLFFFWAIAAGISASGLIGFGKDNMQLPGPLPFLLFFALDGAAAMCMVLMYRRAARAESAIVVRLAVWGLVALSGVFNFTHAPDRPGAHMAFLTMPVVAGILGEFALHETRHATRRRDSRTDRQLTEIGWLHPIERTQVKLQLDADATLSTAQATRRVRIHRAAHRLNHLRHTIAPHPTGRRRQRGGALRRAERRARSALTRANFADPAVAAEVLRQTQVLTRTRDLALLDYTAADPAYAVLASLITAEPGIHEVDLPLPNPRPAPGLPAPTPSTDSDPAVPKARRRRRRPAADRPSDLARPDSADPNATQTDTSGPPPHTPDDTPAGAQPPLPPSNPTPERAHPNEKPPATTTTPHNGTGSQHPPEPAVAGDSDAALIQTARTILAAAEQRGDRLTQVALAEQLRASGHGIANDRLRWLSEQIGLKSPRAADGRKVTTS